MSSQLVIVHIVANHAPSSHRTMRNIDRANRILTRCTHGSLERASPDCRKTVGNSGTIAPADLCQATTLRPRMRQAVRGTYAGSLLTVRRRSVPLIVRAATRTGVARPTRPRVCATAWASVRTTAWVSVKPTTWTSITRHFRLAAGPVASHCSPHHFR